MNQPAGATERMLTTEGSINSNTNLYTQLKFEFVCHVYLCTCVLFRKLEMTRNTRFHCIDKAETHAAGENEANLTTEGSINPHPH